MNEQEYGWFGNVLASEDLESFKQHLTFEEMHRFEKEEYKFNQSRLELLKKYNQIVADRISRQSLIDEIRSVVACRPVELKKLLDAMDNKVLQQVLSVLVLHKKQDKSDA